MQSTRLAIRVRRETGSLVVFAAVAMVALFAFAALTIDVVRFCQQKRDLQSATDAAAMAGAILLTNATPDTTMITAYATAVAAANGIRTNGLDNIQVQWGQWMTNATPASFSANTKPYNAVSVSAQRTFPVLFGAVLGTTQMVPAVQSVAMRSYPSQAENLIPYMFTTNLLAAGYGTSQQSYKNDGNFGKANLDGGDYTTEMDNGCSCTIAVGQTINGVAGNSQTGDGLAGAEGRDVVVPIVDALPSNHGAVTVVGFAVIQITAVSSGGNWSMTFTVVSDEAGTGSGGPSNLTFASDRILVQ